VDYAKTHPGVAVYVKPRRHRPAVIVAEFCKDKFFVVFIQ